jgi:hypothetical protein
MLNRRSSHPYGMAMQLAALEACGEHMARNALPVPRAKL